MTLYYHCNNSYYCATSLPTSLYDVNTSIFFLLIKSGFSNYFELQRVFLLVLASTSMMLQMTRM
jgi:hypothetical protein